MLVKEYFNRKSLPDPGEIGIEIEVEGRALPRVTGKRYWTSVKEASLRGEGKEYILVKPISRKEVYYALEELYATFKRNGTQIYDSDRTSVHIHMNVLDIPLVKVFNIVFLYYMFEKMLINYSGEERKGNLFCLSLEEAERGIFLLRDACKKRDLFKLDDNAIRYASLNLKSLVENGSLEFRTLRGTGDMSLICHWIKILTSIYDFGLELKEPINILEIFSCEGPDKLFDFVFKDTYQELKYKGWQKDMLVSIRNLQYFIYSDIWSDFKPLIEPHIDI